MRLGVANGIVVIESNLKSEFDQIPMTKSSQRLQFQSKFDLFRSIFNLFWLKYRFRDQKGRLKDQKSQLKDQKSQF